MAQGSKWGDFLTEKTQRAGFNRLRNWREDGEVVVWLHTNSRIHKRGFHMIPYVGIKKDEGTGKERKAILFFAFVCHEDVMEVIREGKRHVPKHCPLCRLIHWLKGNGDIGDSETIWDSSVNDRKRDRICSKADFTGDTEGGGDWRLSFKAALQYIIAVIDDGKPGEGIRIAAEKFSLGEKIKSAVQKRIDSEGVEAGDPDRNPYAFKWVFNPDARVKTDYYDAYPFLQAKLTDEIAELLKAPEQDLTGWIAPGDTKRLREIMDAHVVVEGVDLDVLFDNVLPNQGTPSPDEEVEADAEPEVETKKTESKPAKTRSVAEKPKPEPKKAEPKPAPEPEEPKGPLMMDCPSCRGTGKKKDKTDCKLCGGTGKVEAPEEESEAEATPKPEPKPTPKPAPEKKTRTVAPEPEPEAQEAEAEAESVFECGRCHKDVPDSATACPFCGAKFQ